jgi:hypothetical protein
MSAYTIAVVAVVVGLTAGCAGHAAVPSQRSDPDVSYAKAAYPALPRPAVVAQGVSSANSAHLIRSRSWDFTEMRRVFNTVSLLPGTPQTVVDAHRAGLAVILEFDFKRDFLAGEDISQQVEAVVEQIRAQSQLISAVHVADRVNQSLTPDQAIAYLAATGGVLHREVPGLPVLVNVADWELTCGQLGQTRCGTSGPEYQYETNAVVDRIVASGYVDGFTVADNIKDNVVAAQVAAWDDARTRWPSPFLLLATCSQLSFPGARFLGSTSTAAAAVATYVDAPLQAHADGVALWAWHQLYDGRYYTFLDKNGGVNALWNRLQTSAAAFGTAQ